MDFGKIIHEKAMEKITKFSEAAAVPEYPNRKGKMDHGVRCLPGYLPL